MTIPAKYEKGVFRPLHDVSIKEGTVVEVHLPVEAPAKRPRSIADSPFAGMWKDREDPADSAFAANYTADYSATPVSNAILDRQQRPD